MSFDFGFNLLKKYITEVITEAVMNGLKRTFVDSKEGRKLNLNNKASDRE